MQDDDNVLTIEDRDHIRILTLNRPHVLNAISGPLARAIDVSLTDVDADDSVRVAILTGAGRAFCVGADLKAITTEGNQIAIKGKGFAGIAHRKRCKPLICAVEGAALGGGFEICLSADLVTASVNAEFGLPEVRRSRLAAGGGLLRLGRALPTAIAMEIALTGIPIGAERAMQLGLVNRVTAPGEALQAAIELANEIVAGAPLSTAASKRILEAASTMPESEVWRITWEEFRTIRASEDSAEGTRAFLEKRPPRWSGH